MKNLMIMATMLLISTASMAKCELTLGVKKAGAKTAYGDDMVSISTKIQDSLKVQCIVKYRVMPKAEIRKGNILNLQKRLAKLKAEESK